MKALYKKVALSKQEIPPNFLTKKPNDLSASDYTNRQNNKTAVQYLT
jgi:hypothetical protein